MNPRQVDLVIAGASFAGLVCARTAALRGLRTVVIEAKADPGARIHTTGILVKEAGEEIDTPPQFSRTIHGVRLYAPSLKSIDLRAPGYYFLTTDTAGLIRWLAAEARRAGAEINCGRKLEQALRIDGGFLLPQFDLQTRYLVGADGARSTVARLFGLGRNEKFLTGLEIEYENLPRADDSLLHCFLDTNLARGYLAWVAPAPGFFQVGLATNRHAKPDLKAFLARTENLFGFSAAAVKERRGGLIPCGGPVSPFAGPNVLLIGDAAGHVSPLTGGGIRLAFRYGRRSAQLIADYLLRHGPPPEAGLAKELPSFGMKLALRRVMDMGPPNWLYNLMIGTPAMNWFARKVYFHRRAQPGDTLEAFEERIRR
ncbi:MAG: NAD(P)/FAD-dependent oxidoreductase [Rhizobiales bacterium]|nr:NAD(P)/FAD-dependent oxidoreductase [Hyphomicrobiales bacterium]